MQKKYLLAGALISTSLFIASCVSMQNRNPANDGSDSLSLHEMQILSKDATFKFFKSDSTNTQAQPFILTDAEKAELPAAMAKMRGILHKPVINNSINVNADFANTGIDRSSGRKEFRMTSWNIERGQQFDKIKQFFSARENGLCTPALAQSALPWRHDSKDHTILDTDKKQRALDEACALNESDIIVFNEVDDGLCRSGYHSVAAELAQHLNMNYVFAPQFFEAEPSKSGLLPAQSEYCHQENLSLTKNFTGNALMSRYPLTNVKVVPLPVGYLTKDGQPATKEHNDTYCYDWYADEVKGPTLVDKGVREGAKVIFNEDIDRELRYGSRNAIVADVALPNGVVTVIAPHLENKAKPSCREAQMRFLLSQVHTTHPMIIGGDMNTTGSDGGHRSLAKSIWDTTISQTVESQGFWFRIFDVSVPFLSSEITAGKMAFSKLTLTQNPTRVDLKWLRPNPEGHLFSFIKDQGFVFKGDSTKSVSGKDEGPWSTTNARDKMGFEGTHYLNRTFVTEGVSKLDWFFVKTNGDKCFQSKFPRTLGQLHEGVGAKEFPSDHVPITLLFDAPCE
ncbi:MAG: endonuclease/exonuclease/phosphatase family protein [Pseudobdellovibrio sp.]